jgi:Kdo2-lipid IVA lauroyltransferase/acyltransferase
MKRSSDFALGTRAIGAAQYFAARFALLLLQLLPYRLALRTSRALAVIVCALDFRHRQVSRENLLLALGGADVGESKSCQITRAVYRHWGALIADIPHILRTVGRDNWTSFIGGDALDPLRRLHAEGRGVILVTGHIGNPEFGGWLAALAGLPLHSVANRQENRWLNALLERLRTSSGQRIIYSRGALRQGAQALERGEIVAFLADLHGGGKGLAVDFFGHRASTMQGPAVLAVRSGAPILPVAVVRDGPGPRYRAVYAEPIRVVAGAPSGAEVRRITQAYTTALERFIRRWPEQWVWFHRRWPPSGPARPRRRPVHVPVHPAEDDGLTDAPSNSF